MKIGYFGDGPWAHNTFRKIMEDKQLMIVFVVIRYEVQDKVLKRLAEEKNIPVYAEKNINSVDFIKEIQSYSADLFVSMSFNQIFKKDIMSLPPLKIINCHAGKLPYYRGRNILNWVLINDEKEFGITVHYVDEGIDSGDIILQKCFSITDIDDYCSLLEKAYVECADILYTAIKQIQYNDVHITKQKDIDEIGIYCGIRRSGDEIIDFNQTSREVFNFIRALVSPGPIATTYVRGYEVKISKAEMVAGAKKYINTVGQVVGKDKDTFMVKTADTILRITEYTCDTKIVLGDRLG